MDILLKQWEHMTQQGRIINPQPGLTAETRLWEQYIFSDVAALRRALERLHTSLSADAVAEVLLEASTLMVHTSGLLNNIGVCTMVDKAVAQIIEADAAGADRPNLLPLVLDKE